MEVLDWSKPYHRFFEEMTRIPHGSHHEKQYSDYLVEFAKKHHFRYKQYPIGNVIIYKEASEGYEDHPTVVMQSHMDMVWEKRPGSKHNFETDPLDIYIEDGWLYARETTLGADDGTGVAYMLSVLEDPDLKHPALECIFTVQEETGLDGAFALEPEDIKGRRYISLDDGGGGYITTITSAGGMGWKGKITAEKEEMPEQFSGYRLHIGGLTGGHSGECIDEEKGNAIKLAARVIKAMQMNGICRIAEFTGGDKDNAIPRECTVLFAVDFPEEKVQKIVKEELAKIHQELKFSDSGVEIQVEKEEMKTVWEEKAARTLIDFLYVYVNGRRHKSMKLPGLVTASSNLASVQEKDGKVEIVISLRSAEESYLDEMAMQLRILSEQFGLEMEESSRYPGWSYEENSTMRERLREAVEEVMNRPLEELAVHGGLECGVFKQKWPDMDMVTLGPVGENVHTPDERLNLASFDLCYSLLKTYLTKL